MSYNVRHSTPEPASLVRMIQVKTSMLNLTSGSASASEEAGWPPPPLKLSLSLNMHGPMLGLIVLFEFDANSCVPPTLD